MPTLRILPAALAAFLSLLAAAPSAWAQSITNGTFETPTVSTFQSSPAGSGWTWSGAGLSGISSGTWSGSGFGVTGTRTGQFAYLVWYAGVGGSVSQSVTFPTPGRYRLTESIAGRDIASGGPGNAAFAITISGGIFSRGGNTYTGMPFQTYEDTIDVPTAGTYTLTYSNVTGSGEDTFFVDDVSISYVGPGASNPAGTDKTLTVAAGGIHTFATGDWGFTDPYSSPADNFAAVTLTTLPTSGTLMVDYIPVTTTPRSVDLLNATPAGATWTARESTREWLSITSSADGSKLAAVVSGGQIYTSTDSGLSWTARESNRYWSSITSSADGSKLAAVVSGGQIYTSTDSGLSWTARESNRYWSSITSSADGSKLAAVELFGQIHTSTDGGVSWTARESNRYWSSITSSADGSKLAAVERYGRIYVSTDGGVSWTARESNRNWASITSSADGSRLAAVEFEGRIYISTDGGANWVARLNYINWNSITSSADGSKLAAAAEGQIYTSTDGGVNWVAREDERFWISITSSADGNRLAAVAVRDQIYTSTGSGVISYSGPATAGSTSFTFQVQDDAASNNLDLSPNTITFNIVPTVVSSTAHHGSTATTLTITGTGFSTTPGDNTVVFTPSGSGTVTAATPTSLTVGGLSGLSLGALSAVVTTHGQTSGPPVQVATVVPSLPAGTDKTLTVAAGGTHTFATGDWGFTDPNSSPPDNFAAVTLTTLPASGTLRVDSIPVTTAPRSVSVIASLAGATWTARESNRSWHSITSSADGSKLAAVAAGGQIYTSIDGGESWTARASNRGWQSITSSADGSKLAAVVHNGQIHTSTDGGASWTARESNRDWLSITSSADGSKLAAVVYGGQIYTSTDGGVSWTVRESNRYWYSITSSADGSKLAAVAHTGQIHTSTDGGASWTARESNRYWISITSSADGSKLAAVAYFGQIYISTDGGVTWTARESSRGWYSITSSADGSKLAAVVYNGQIHTSTDGGASWTARESNREWYSITSSADGNSLAAAVAGGQIYTSTDGVPVISYSGPATAGSASFTFQVQDDAANDNIDPTPNTITFNIVPTVVTSTAGLPPDATTLTITGTGFSTTPGDNTVVFSPAGSGTVTAATPTSLTVSGLSGLSLGALSAVVTTNGQTSGPPVQVATVILPQNPAGTDKTLTVAAGGTHTFASSDWGFTDPNSSPADNFAAVTLTTLPTSGTLMVDSIPVTTTPRSVSLLGTGVPVISYSAPATAGSASFTFQVQDDAISDNIDPTPNTITFNIVPTVVTSTMALAPDATTLTITGTGFSTTPGDNTVVFTPAGSGTVTAATPTSLTVSGLSGLSLGALSAVVTTNGQTSGPPVQVATVMLPQQNPEGTDKTLTVAAGGTHTFAPGDWGFTDPNSSPADNFAAVILATLPGSGTMMVDSGPVTTTPRSVNMLAAPTGATWTAQESIRHWWSITSSADGSKLAAVVLGGQIHISTDGGVSWTARESYRNWWSITCSADGSKLAAVTWGGQIYTSTDGGASWTARENNRGWVSITSSADGSRLAAVVEGGQIYTSTDGGASWTARENNRGWVSITSSADGSRLAAVEYEGQIHTSTDGGASWTARENNRGWVSITSSADGSKLAAVGYYEQIYTSTDGGVSWTARESSRNWRSITSSADGSKLAAVVEGGQIHTSTDGGVSWTARENNRGWRSITSLADGSRLAAVVNGGHIHTSVGIDVPVISYSAPATAGSASFTFQVQDDAANDNIDPTPNTITFNIVPTVVTSTAGLAPDATTLTINGTGFSTTPGDNTVVFSPAGSGTVTAATPTSVTVGGLSGLSLGALSAVVTTNGQSSGAAVQVATVSLSLQSWRQIHFGTASNTGIAADTYDADNDGLANLLEYAFALDPMAGGGTAQLPQAVHDAGANTFTVQFAEPAGMTGVTYGARSSPSLEAESWQPIPDTGTGGTHIFRVPLSGETRLFIRLEVTAAP